jgi:hypothetical protein
MKAELGFIKQRELHQAKDFTLFSMQPLCPVLQWSGFRMPGPSNFNHSNTGPNNLTLGWLQEDGQG